MVPWSGSGDESKNMTLVSTGKAVNHKGKRRKESKRSETSFRNNNYTPAEEMGSQGSSPLNL